MLWLLKYGDVNHPQWLIAWGVNRLMITFGWIWVTCSWNHVWPTSLVQISGQCPYKSLPWMFRPLGIPLLFTTFWGDQPAVKDCLEICRMRCGRLLAGGSVLVWLKFLRGDQSSKGSLSWKFFGRDTPQKFNEFPNWYQIWPYLKPGSPLTKAENFGYPAVSFRGCKWQRSRFFQWSMAKSPHH